MLSDTKGQSVSKWDEELRSRIWYTIFWWKRALWKKDHKNSIHCPSTELSACPVSDRNKFSKSTARSWRSNLLVIYIKCKRQDLKTWKYFQVCACVVSHFSHAWLCVSMNSSLPGSSVHGILQARILHWVAMPSSRESSQSKDWTCVS